MGSASKPPAPTTPDAGQIVPAQTNVAATTTTTAFAQMTQVAPYVPPHVWTTETLLDLHAKQKEVILDNNRLVENQRNREHTMGLVVLAGFAGILAVGFLFAYWKIDLGRDIVIAAVSAGLGYAAGYGTGLTKRQ